MQSADSRLRQKKIKTEQQLMYDFRLPYTDSYPQIHWSAGEAEGISHDIIIGLILAVYNQG